MARFRGRIIACVKTKYDRLPNLIESYHLWAWQPISSLNSEQLHANILANPASDPLAQKHLARYEYMHIISLSHHLCYLYQLTTFTPQETRDKKNSRIPF